MKIGKACAIFMQIDSDKYTVEEKGTAIYEVLQMPTHNGITKGNMLSVINFLLRLAFDVPEKPAKCPLYFTPETDGLKSSWKVAGGGTVFCNPPYGREIGKWVQKAYEEAQGGTPIVLLIPARTDTSYFHDYIYGKAEIRFIRGRLRFTDDDGNAADPAPFPSMLVIYNGTDRRS